jgi:hypothetical protein
MKSNILSKKLKAVLSEKKLNKLGLSIGFAKRLRAIVPFQLIVSVIASLGDKETKHFSEIHRYFNQLTNKNVRYKPFHNQLSKTAFAQLMREVAERVFNHWLTTKLSCHHQVLSGFDKILIQDGSSFAVNEQLKKDYPGRFTAISPAAVELHVTYDVKKGAIEKSILTPDSFSERAEVPEAHTLKNHLLLGDRGYYSGQLIHEIDAHGGYYILRAMRLSRIPVYQAVREDGKVVSKRVKPLSALLKSLPKRQMVDMEVEINERKTRLIALWSLKEKRHTFLVTNLTIAQFSAREVSLLYRLRWQVELLFKECKSYNNLQGFQTSNPNLMEALVWASLIATMLKRFVCSSIEQFYALEMSTLTVSKTTVYWWYTLLESIINNKRKQLNDVLERTYFFLKENAARAHPKRDRLSGLYQFAVEPSFRGQCG